VSPHTSDRLRLHLLLEPCDTFWQRASNRLVLPMLTIRGANIRFLHSSRVSYRSRAVRDGNKDSKRQWLHGNLPLSLNSIVRVVPRFAARKIIRTLTHRQYSRVVGCNVELGGRRIGNFGCLEFLIEIARCDLAGNVMTVSPCGQPKITTLNDGGVLRGLEIRE
jgi:hypothetical protein